MPRYFTAAEDAMVLRLPAGEVQRLTGRSLKVIGTRRVLLKRMGFRVADQRTSAEKLKVGKSVWTADADELVRQHRPIVVVRMLGIPMPTVLRRRKALGLPPVGRYRVPKRPRIRPAHRRWTKAELRIALSLPPRVAVKRLPGRTLSAIHAVRFHRKRAGAKFKAAKRGTRKEKKS